VPRRGNFPPRDDVNWSAPKFEALRGVQHVFAQTTLWTGEMMTIRYRDQTLRDNAEYTDAGYLPRWASGPRSAATHGRESRGSTPATSC